MIPILLSLLACGDHCDVHGDCENDEICWFEDCEPVFDRDWSVDIVSAEVGTLHPDGNPWDDDGTAPDLFAEFGLEDGDGCFTTSVLDSYDPLWDEACVFFVPDDPLFLVNLWDDDAGDDDFVAGYYWEGNAQFLDLARTAGEEVGFEDETGTVLLWVFVEPI